MRSIWNGRMSVSTSNCEKGTLNSSCSVAMLGSPVSFRSLRALRLRMTGAYVSGMVHLSTAMNPAKIICTQNIQRQPTLSPTKPPTIGPRTGPPYGAAAKRAMAKPRSSLSQTSEIVPPASVRGADAKMPQKNRHIRSVWMFLATAQGIMKTAAARAPVRNVVSKCGYGGERTY